MASRKNIKKMLVLNGFHHSHGYFISDETKAKRIKVEKNRLSFTKDYNRYNSKDCITYREISLEEVLVKVNHFFNTDDNTLNWERIFNKQAKIGACYPYLKEFLIKNYKCPEKL